MKRFTSLLAAIVVTAVVAVLSGCTYLDQAIETADQHPTAEIAAKAAVQYATLRLIDDGERAQRVKQAADTAAALVADNAVTALEDLEAAVRAEIDFSKLPLEDALLVNTLIGAVRLELERSVEGREVIDPKHKVVIAKVLGWVSEAASLRLPKTREGPASAFA